MNDRYSDQNNKSNSLRYILENKHKLKQLDEYHRQIKEILQNKQLEELTTEEKNQISKILNKIARLIEDIFRINVKEITIQSSQIPNAFVRDIKFVLPISPHACEIYYLDKIIKLLTPKEITAVLLHEIGHTYYWFFVFLSFSTYAGGLIATFITALTLSTTLLIGSSIAALGVLLSYSLSSRFNILAEYYADKFTTILGYGKYLISALEKVTNYSLDYFLYSSYIRINMPSKKDIEKYKEKLKNEEKSLLRTLINLFIASHPSRKDRYCKILRYMYQQALKMKSKKQSQTAIKEIKRLLKRYKLENECKLE